MTERQQNLTLTIDAVGLYPRRRAIQKDTAGEPEPEAVQACREWLRLFCTHNYDLHFNTEHTSYGYKHLVESWTQKTTGTRLYVENGAFIKAAVLEGYAFRPDAPGSPNAEFNMRICTEKELKARTAAEEAYAEALKDDAMDEEEASKISDAVYEATLKAEEGSADEH
jgi:hypothetical protein